ncbi:hypothetical protein ACHAXR_009470 [Thalassiosira sp. AJA248-18]
MSTPNSSLVPRPSPGISRRCSLDSSCLQESKMPAMHRRCSFSTISVREYDQTVGDSPSCQDGAPITLGWKYAQQKLVSLDEFEETRKNKRRGRDDLILGAAERRKVLVMNGATLMEILHAERLVALKSGVASVGMQLGRSLNFNGQGKKRTAPRKSVMSRAA